MIAVRLSPDHGQIIGRHLWSVALAVVALSLTLAGCAAQDDPQVATAATAPTSPAPPEASGSAEDDDALRFVRCMRDAGVDVDDPQPDGQIKVKPGDKTDPDFPDAIEACKALLPREGGGPQAGISPDQIETLRRYAVCMRENGVPEFPDPGPAGFTTAPEGAAVDRANQLCVPVVGLDPSAGSAG
jgi:hypothetical protein